MESREACFFFSFLLYKKKRRKEGRKEGREKEKEENKKGKVDGIYDYERKGKGPLREVYRV